jgi:hypothetical protein
VTINPKAVLGTVLHPAIKNHLQDQGHILVAQHPAIAINLKAISGMALHLVIKKVFRHAASHILAGQHLVTATDHKETSAQALVRVKENLTPADHHPV